MQDRDTNRPVPSTRASVEALGPFKFYQSENGHRLTSDSVLLAGFALGSAGASFESVADLGSGSGAVALQIAARENCALFTCFEIDPALAELARKNINENGLQERGDVVEGDLLETTLECPAGSFTYVVSNPPYVKKGTGRVSPVAERAAARSEQSCTLPGLVDAAARLIGNKGRAAFVYPARRLDEMITELNRAGLKALRLRFVYTGKGSEAKLFLIEAGRSGELKVERPVSL